MPKNKLLHNFFSSGLQAIAVQVLGGVFFYVISIYLSKDTFGAVNLINALCLIIVTFLGFGLEQVVIRRIAASSRSDWTAAAFFAHTILGFIITLVLLLALSLLIKDQNSIYQYLPWFFAAQGLIYAGTPLKQFLNAKERFTPYGIIAVISNIFKIAVALVVQQRQQLNINTIALILVCAGIFELCSLLLYLLLTTGFSFKFRYHAYIKLLKESSAQYLSVIFDMSLSRMDWVLVGIIASNVVLANYSFAYRAFELARLPVFVMGQVILPRMARSMVVNGKPDIVRQQQINSLLSVEIFFAGLILLLLNILWTPVVGFITSGKYGQANSSQFLILSLCIPVQFFVNLLWSLTFSAKKYKAASLITIACAVTNIVLNLVLISNFNGVGAAIAFLVTTLMQGFLYYKLVNKKIVLINLRPMLIFFAALVIYFISMGIPVHFGIQLFIAVVLFLLVAAFSGQISRQHIVNVKKLLS